MSLPAAPQFNEPSGAPAPSDPADLSRPLYPASFGQAFKRFFKKYATFSGRASRSEYWWAQLALFLMSLIPYILIMIAVGVGTAQSTDEKTFTDTGYGYTTVEQAGTLDSPGLAALAIIGGILMMIVSLGTIIPSLAITWRRLHDANLAGPFFFIAIVPLVGVIILFIFLLLRAQPGGERFDRR